MPLVPLEPFEGSLSPASSLARTKISISERVEALIFSGEPLTALLEAQDSSSRTSEALATWICFQKTEFLRSLLKENEDLLSEEQILDWRLWLRLFGSVDPTIDRLLRRRIRKNSENSLWKNIVTEICESAQVRDAQSYLFRHAPGLKTTQRLLLSAVLFRQSIQEAAPSTAAQIGLEYESLSLYASHGRCEDVFGVLRSVQRNVQSLPPGSLFQRGRRLLSFSHQLGSRLGWGRVASLLDTRKANRSLSPSEQKIVFPLVAETLGDLKGPMMKAGQILSYFALDSQSALQKTLQVLQKNSPPMPFSTVSKQIEMSLKVPFESLFRTFDFNATGVGSMAQVHRATLRNGREVAVKVLFPNIREIVQTDIRYLRIASPLLRISFPHMDSKNLLREIESSFLNECDLLREIAMQKRLISLYAGDENVIIPKVLEEWSSQNVMIMEYIRGQNLEDFSKSASQEARNRAGKTITRLALSSGRNAIFNSDPNPSNYLFMDDGRVAFLDFGASVEWTQEIANIWADVCRSSVQRDFPRFKNAVARGLITEIASEKSLRELFETVAPLEADSWWEAGHKKISKTFLANSMRNHFVKILDPKRAFKLNPRFILGMRIYFGHMAVVSALGSEADWADLIREELSEFQAVNPQNLDTLN